MDPVTGSLIGAGISAVGGWLTGRSSDNAASRDARRAREYDEDVRHLERSWFQDDKANDRAYAARILANDRNYTRKVFLQDQQNERNYLARKELEARQYNRSVALEDRRINRADMNADYQANRKNYYQDSFNLRQQNDERARLQAKTRGIDFKSLVADAQAAGFSPMTALSMAHAYSTEVDYASNNIQTFQGQLGTPQMASPGAGGGGGGSGGGYAAPVSGGVAAGNFSSSGTGYSGASNPGFSSAGFMAEAIGQGVETWFNRKAEQDTLAKLLDAEKKAEELDKAAGRAPPPTQFGQVLTQQRPFKAAQTKTPVPAFARSAGDVVAKPRDGRPPRAPYLDERIPMRGPNGDRIMPYKDVAERMGFKKWGNATAGDLPELIGELPGEAFNAAQVPEIVREGLGVPLAYRPGFMDGLDNSSYGASGETRHGAWGGLYKRY